MKIMTGLYQIKVPNPTSDRVHLNSYIIQGENGWLMVDTGWNTPEALNALAEGLQEIELDFSDIKEIVITHSHPDHYGLAGKIRERSKAKVILHEKEIRHGEPRIETIDDLLHIIAKWLIKNGAPDDELPQLLEASPGLKAVSSFVLADVFLNGNENISTGIFDFEVILTPGHSPGHICLYEPNKKILLSGDHILPHITPNIGLGPWSGENPLGAYLGSLKSMEHLDVDTVLPAHEWVFNGLAKRIEELLHHHEKRKNNIMRALGTDPMTAFDMAFLIPWIIDGRETTFGSLSPMDKRMAIWETLAHLELLLTEGGVKTNSKGDIVFYSVR